MANKQKIVLLLDGDAKGAIKATQVTGKGLDSVTEKGKRTSSQFSDIAAKGAKWGAVAGGAAAAGAALLVKQQLDLIDNTAKTSDKLGIATEKLTAMRVQAELTGVGANTLDMGLQRMVRRLAEAAEGTGEAKGALAELNLDAKALANLSPDKQFGAIADAMENVDKQSDKVRLAFKLFDSEGVALVNTLKGGSAAALEAEKFTEQWGLAVSRIDASKIEQANDAMSMLTQASGGFWTQLTVNVSPALAGMANEMLSVGEGFGTAEELADKAFKAIITGAGFVGDMGRGLQIIWKGATMVVAEWFASVWEAIAGADRLITGLLNKLPTSMGGGSFETSDFLQNVSGALRSTADTMKTELSELVNGALPSDLLKAKIQAWEDAATAAGKQVAEGAKVVTGDYEAAAGAAEQLTAAEKKRRDEAEKLAATKAELLDAAEYEVGLLSRELTATYAGADALAVFNREKAIEVALRNESVQTLLPAELEKYTAMIGAQYDLAIAIAAKTEADKAAADAAKESAGAMDKFLSGSFGDGLAEGFNQGSKALASFIDGFGELLDVQAQYNAAQLDAAATDADKANAAAKYQSEQVGLYGDMAAASKQFFDEGSKGYKALQAAEQAYRAIELALAAKAAIAKGVNAVLTQGEGDPYSAFGRMAAMAGVVAALGVAIGGIGGGGSSVATPEQTHNRAMASVAGTVLGSNDASESLTNSLDILADLSDSQLGYTMQMAQSLRNIEASFVGYVSTVSGIDDFFRGTNFSPITEGYGTNPEKPSTVAEWKTPTINDVISGVLIDRQQALNESIIEGNGYTNAINDSLYKADMDLASLYTESVAALVNGSKAAIKTLGLSISGSISDIEIKPFDIDPRWDNEQIDSYVAAYFSALGDSIVSEVAPAIEQFRRGGEGLFETLTRVTGQVFALRDATDSLGIISTATLSIDQLMSAADNLSKKAGGLEVFVENVDDFLNFSLTDFEQFERVQRQVNALFSGMEMAVLGSREEVSDFVAALDLTADAGREAFTTLTSASDLLDDYYSQLEDYSNSAYDFDTALGLNDGRKELREALAAVGQNLDVVETAAMGGVSALAELFSGLSDVQKAGLEPFTDAILDMVPAISSIVDELRAFGNSGLAGLSASQNLAGLQSDYAGLIAAARGGDLSRAGEITTVGQNVITAAGNTATSEYEYRRIVAQTSAAALQLADYISGDSPELTVAKDQLTVLEEIRAELAGADVVAMQSTGPAPVILAPQSQGGDGNLAAQFKQLEKTLEQFMTESRAGHGAIASNTNKMAKLLDRWDDGDAMATREASA